MKNEKLYLLAYYALNFLVKILPNFILSFIAKITARIVFYLNKKHRLIIDKNLQICFSEMSEFERKKLSLKIYENYAKFGIDCIKNQNTSKEKVREKVVFEDIEIFKKIIESKRPFILTTAHFGNWELMSLSYGAFLGAMSIVGRALDSKAMDKILSKNRKQFDIDLIDKKGGVKKMLKALKDGRALGILTDQRASDSESIKVKFFNQEVNFLSGASVIAKKTNAIMMSVFIYQKDDKFVIKNYEPIDASEKSIEELTIYQAKCCEEIIKFKPDEYFFFHKRFNKEIYE